MVPALSANEIDRQLITRGNGQIEQNRHRDGGSRHRLHRFAVLGNPRRASSAESPSSFESKSQDVRCPRGTLKIFRSHRDGFRAGSR